MWVVIERVEQTIRRYGMLAPGQRVGVAVSGGADSVCLLDVLRELAPRWKLQLTVLHLDHQLRGEESQGDASFVREMAARLGLEAVVRAVDVRRLSRESGENLEQAARRARREFFRELLEEGRLDRVALGHTRSDQAETVLFRFLRGSGSAGLAGIRRVTREGIVRPLLEVDRSEVLGFLRQRGIPWREDSSNLDRRFARNRIRHELLPALARDWNPALEETLAQTAALAQDEEAYWGEVVEKLAEAHVHLEGRAVCLRTTELLALPSALSRRLIRRAVQTARGGLDRIDFPHIEQVLRLASGRKAHDRLQIPGLEVFRSYDWMRLAPLGQRGEEREGYRFTLAVPGRYAIPGSRLAIELELIVRRQDVEIQHPRPGCGYTGGDSELDWSRVSGSLVLRNWRPGDRFRPIGRAGQALLKSLFQQARIPSWERRRWPIINCGEEIVWTARFGAAAEWAPNSASQTVLKVREIEGVTGRMESSVGP
jgi:tRNA(Ile)-lysidine synthase